jgi:lipoyl(octanoyl) transferase
VRPSISEGVATPTTQIIHLGRTGYRYCTDIQVRLRDARIRGEIEDTLLLTEHDHVYTIGTSGGDDHLLASEKELSTVQATVEQTDRGGDITYHGPGQLVVYPIIDLRQRTMDLHRYLRDLEDVVIIALKNFDVTGGRIDGYTGIWVDGEKVCAIGIHCRSWVTMHGFALNVDTDLSYFNRIIPCGIFERGVTSLRDILGRDIDRAAVEAEIVRSWSAVFQTAVRERALADVLRQTVSGGAFPS